MKRAGCDAGAFQVAKLYIFWQISEIGCNFAYENIRIRPIIVSDSAMTKSKTTFKDIKNALKWMGAILSVMLFYGFSMALYGHTLVEWWEPLGIALTAVLVIWFLLRGFWGKVWRGVNPYVALLGHMVVMTGVVLFLILGLNFWFADDTTLHTEEVTVEERLQEKHYHTKRVGRNRYRRGNPYYKYILRVRFDNGRLKEIEVPLKRYNRTRTGGKMTLDLETGLWGYPVITTWF